MSEEDMKVDATKAKALLSQLQAVSERVYQAANGRNVRCFSIYHDSVKLQVQVDLVRLVAVSKLKPVTDILALHQAPTSHVHFGENYAQELGEKAKLLPRSIQWHFIGGLQSKKAKPLAASIPNLFCVSSVDSAKKATQLDKGRAELLQAHPEIKDKLNIHVQVNTSGEESKSGVSPGSETLELCRHVVNDCPNLNLLGLMTIGAIARSKETTPENENEDFVTLTKEKEAVEKELGLELELSMGMSEDFEGAIALGSGEVRVGSTIFGERPAKADFKVKQAIEGEKN